jgi:hypothetical protein
MRARWPQFRFYFGIDLGQSRDPTAIAIIREQIEPVDGPNTIERDPPLKASFAVVHLARLELGRSYPAQIEEIKFLLRRPPIPLWQTEVAVDATGVGRAVSDLMREKGIRHKPITITAGDSKRIDEGRHKVGKSHLVGTLLTSLHDQRLKIAANVVGADFLKRELEDFRVSYTDAGSATFSAREGQHDDLVLALALAHWIAIADRAGEYSVQRLY